MEINTQGISIITIVLNGESFIEETILSVIRQKNVKVEYIIIDGGSTDQTLEKISKYRDYIDKVVSEKDGGIYYAINKGIALASYDLIGLVHCGDFYEPDSFFQVYNEYKKTTADIIYGDINFLECIFDKSIKKFLSAEHKLLKEKMSIFHPATFVSRKCYEKHGLYDTNYRIAADYDFFLKLFLRGGKFSHIPVVLVNFRLDGISSTKTTALIKENYKVRIKNLGRLIAVKYLITTIPNHIFFSLRKTSIELMIGKKNYARLKIYFSKSKDLLQRN